MKPLIKLCTGFLILALFLACNSDDQDDYVYHQKLEATKNNEKVIGTKQISPSDFTMNFYTRDIQSEATGLCGSNQLRMIQQTGSGNSELLGNFSFAFQFCGNPTQQQYFMGPYSNLTQFVFKDGTIAIRIAQGAPIVSERLSGIKRNYQTSFIIEGGTGAYKGVKGHGNIYAENIDLNTTKHIWKGEIVPMGLDRIMSK